MAWTSWSRGTGYTGEVGFEIYLRNASRDGMKFWDTMLEAGEPHSLSPIGPCQIRRVEAGILSYGSDIALDNNTYSDYHFLNPYEADLGYTVELDQEADFIGKEALRRIADEGVGRKVVGIELDCDPLVGYIEDYLQVVDDGSQIGQVSSAFWSPRLEKNIWYASAPIGLADTGTGLTVRMETGEYDATVVEGPSIDPRRETVKADLKVGTAKVVLAARDVNRWLLPSTPEPQIHRPKERPRTGHSRSGRLGWGRVRLPHPAGTCARCQAGALLPSLRA